MSTKLFIFTIASTFLCPLMATAGQSSFGIMENMLVEKGSRGIRVEQRVRNHSPSFVVRVDVDNSRRTYQDGELMKVNVVSEKGGYLYLLYRQADGKVVCLFPNKYQSNNRIQPKKKVIVPAGAHSFNLRVGAPFGEEVLLAVVSLKPLKASDFGAKSLTESEATPVEVESILKAVRVELRPNPREWAEHHVKIKTVPKVTTVQQSQRKPQRLGVFVGISDYKDESVDDLSVSHRDAEFMAEIMEKHGKLDGGKVLTNSDATKNNIQKAILALKAKSKPGDELFIYWSGHGGKLSDTNGDEDDGKDEYLIPYDAGGNTPEEAMNSIVLDDTFGRWIQDLDGRRVVVILDTCYSGGMSATTKSVGRSLYKLLGENGTQGEFDFLDSEMLRTKDVGQKDAAMLCSSNSDETSLEGDKVSIMTGFLLKRVLESDRLTLDNAHQYVKKEVIDLLERHEVSKKQTPILINHIGEVFVKP